MKQPSVNQFYERIKALAKKESAEFDLHGFCKEETSVLFQKKQLKNCSSSEARHLNIRALKGKKAGYSYTKDFSKEGLEACFRQAVEALRLSDKEERGDLSESQNYEDFSAFFRPEAENKPLEEKIKSAEEINSACLDFNKAVQPIYSSVGDTNFYGFFANSRGLQSSYRSYGVLAQCFSLAAQGESRANGQSQSFARSYKNLDFKKIGSESAEKALKKLNYSIPRTKKYPALFKAGPAAAGLLSRLADMLSGKTVFDGLSLFKGSLGEKAFSSSFSLYDEPLALWGRLSRPFDGEGFPSERTALAEGGVLRNYLTSSFFAKALKAPHTKKAFWQEDRLDVSASNLVMAEGDSSFEELAASFPQTLVIDVLKGWAGYNPVSGDFSIESEGFLWEGGEAKPLCQFTVSGNIKDLFANILKIGKDSKIYGGSVKAPSFLAESLMIAGK